MNNKMKASLVMSFAAMAISITTVSTTIYGTNPLWAFFAGAVTALVTWLIVRNK